MDPETKQSIIEHYEKLSERTREKIRSVNIRQYLELISELKPLEQEQVAAIENEVMLVLLGLDDIPSLTTNIKFSAQISRDRADTIARAITQSLFIPHVDLLDTVIREVRIFENAHPQPKAATSPQREIMNNSKPNIHNSPPINSPQKTPTKIQTKLPPNLPLAPQPKKQQLPPVPKPQPKNITKGNVFGSKLSTHTNMPQEEKTIEQENLTKSHIQDTRESKPGLDPYREDE